MSMADALAAPHDRRATGAASAGHGLAGSVVRTREGLDALAARWQGLEHYSQGFNLFQSLGWARAVFDFEAARGNAAFDPVISTI